MWRARRAIRVAGNTPVAAALEPRRSRPLGPPETAVAALLLGHAHQGRIDRVVLWSAVPVPPAGADLLGGEAAPPQNLVDDARRVRPAKVGGRPRPLESSRHEQLLLDLGETALPDHA